MFIAAYEQQSPDQEKLHDEVVFQASVYRMSHWALVKHKTVKEAYTFYQGTAGTNPLRDDVRRGFRFGSILFEEYFGTVTLANGTSVRLIPPREGVAFPLGTLDWAGSGNLNSGDKWNFCLTSA